MDSKIAHLKLDCHIEIFFILVKRNQRRNLLAAHRIIYKQTEPIIKEESEESSDGKEQ